MDETINGGMKFCENCGARLQPGAKFCDSCGQKIVYTGESAFPPVPAAEPQEQGFPAEEQGQAQGFPEEPQGQFQGSPAEPQGSAYQQNDYQQNNYQQNSYQQNNYQKENFHQGPGRPASGAVLPAKLGCVLAYLFPLIGCVALYFLGDREDDFVRHHLNQAICLCILQVIRFVVKVDILQTVLGLFLFFGWVVGMYGSIAGKKTEIPLISQVKIV